MDVAKRLFAWLRHLWSPRPATFDEWLRSWDAKGIVVDPQTCQVWLPRMTIPEDLPRAGSLMTAMCADVPVELNGGHQPQPVFVVCHVENDPEQCLEECGLPATDYVVAEIVNYVVFIRPGWQVKFGRIRIERVDHG